MNTSVLVRTLGRQPYHRVWQAMRAFTDKRTDDTRDEIWLLEHDPVFTLGQAGKKEHLIAPGEIPVIETDRGGQVTYHGPGQLVAYCLIDIKRMSLGVRPFVRGIENSLIKLLADYQISAHIKEGAPGVYVDQAKIGSIGLRVRRGRSYHGLSLNVDMSLEPFARINPCGYQNLKMTQIKELWEKSHTNEHTRPNIRTVGQALISSLTQEFEFSKCQYLAGWSQAA